MFKIRKVLLYIFVLTSFVFGFFNQTIYAGGESIGTTYTNDDSYEVSIPAFVSFDSYNQSEIVIEGNKLSKKHELTISVESTNDFQLKNSNGDQSISYTVKDGDTVVTQNTSWTYPLGNDLTKYETDSSFSKTLSLKLNGSASSRGTYSDQLVFTFTDKECYELNVTPYVIDDPSETMTGITYDVYVNNQIVARETWSFSHYVPAGSTYKVENISLTSDQYTYKGQESYMGTVSENTTVNLNVQNKFKTITFDANGGTCSTTSKVYEYNKAYGELPTPTYSDSSIEFKGWYKADGTLVQENDICTSNMTLYAHWSTTATYKMVSGFDFWVNLDKDVTSVVFTYIDTPTDATLKDLSANGDNSVVGWLDGTTYYVSTQNQYKKVIFNENSAQMFFMHEDIQSIDFSNVDTHLVTSMSSMFSNTGIESIDLSNFDTSNVTTMSGMFNYCSHLKSLNLSNFNTGNVTTMHGMFEGSSALESITFSENFNTASVTDMEDMFQDCSSLTSLDLTSFNMSNVLYVMGMFKEDSNLNAIYATSNFDLSSVLQGYDYQMFDGCTKLPNYNSAYVNKTKAKAVSDGGYIYMDVRTVTFDPNGGECSENPWHVENGFAYNKFGTLPSATKDGYTFGGWYTANDGGTKVTGDTIVQSESSDITLYAHWIGASYKLTTGSTFNNMIPSSATKVVFTDTAVPDAATIYDLSSAKDNSVLGYLGVTEEDQTTWYVTTQVTNQKIIFNEDSSSMFDESISEIKHRLQYILFNNNIDSSLVTNMSSMFKICSSLKELDVTTFNTDKVTDMSYMFTSCQDLTNLDVTNFNTSNVTNMTYMFAVCNDLTSIDVSKFDTSNVTNMSYMFGACGKLSSLDVTQFVTSSVTDMSGMFISCDILTTLDLSSFDTSKVTKVDDMFRACTNLTNVYARTQDDLDKLKTASNTPESVIFSLKTTSESSNENE